ncbi:MAG: protein of unknown function DUF45 [Barrevirus sp.]|uniref:Uncharacterized protein n=1 Tax=Barrevirus sp. TaxID=2487763 RepID=A0A3G4ZTV8_9VIRU|nr:MAG: protein of unknown function DUF45 [Barrevirus sp.]
MNGLIIILLYIFIIAIIIIIGLEKNEGIIYVKSTIDNDEYLVRDLPDKVEAANMLAQIKANMFKLRDYLVEHIDEYPDYKPYIKQLGEKLKDDIVINESSADSAYTSYSVNKGEQIVFCIRSKYDGTIHTLNLLMYVAIHEMAHVACPEYGHGELFKKIFAFLLDTAIKLNIYTKVDFYEDPTEYCGMIVSESII